MNNNNNTAAAAGAVPVAQETVRLGQLARENLVAANRITGTILTKEGLPSKEQSADGCIVPKRVLNDPKKSAIVLTPVGWYLLNLWQSNQDQQLNRMLDAALMNLVVRRAVRTLAEAKVANKAIDRQQADQLGYKKLTKSKACTECDNKTLRAYYFVKANGDKALAKPLPYCHRKDCIEARDAKARQIRASPTGPQGQTANNNNNNYHYVAQGPIQGPIQAQVVQDAMEETVKEMHSGGGKARKRMASHDGVATQPVLAAPSRPISEYSEDELMAKILDAGVPDLVKARLTDELKRRDSLEA